MKSQFSYLSLCKIYSLVVLVAAAIISPPPYSVPAAVLALAGLYFTTPRPAPGQATAYDIGLFFLTPLLLLPGLERFPILPDFWLPLAVSGISLPLLPVIDRSLKRLAASRPVPRTEKVGRQVTSVFLSLVVATLAVVVIALVVDRPVLLYSGLLFLIYITTLQAINIIKISRTPLAVDIVRKRILAGTTDGLAADVTNRAGVELRYHLESVVDWLQATLSQYPLAKETTELYLMFTPPLAGEATPAVRLTLEDERGFLRTAQNITPVRFEVIPRASYARWLAEKYLAQASSGDNYMVEPAESVARRVRGTEYTENRTYQPGDPLRAIDWKHTLKLSQLIVKEYREANRPSAIMAVNLAVPDAEAADRLAFNLLTVSLTLARENIPSALTAYNHEKVLFGTDILEPNDNLRRCLSLLSEIKPVSLYGRYLEPPVVARIRRNINQLKRTEGKPARRLLDILDFEHRSLEASAMENPAALALSSVSSRVPGPAIVLLISQLNHDAEAVMIASEKLTRRQVTTIPVETA